jgi:hypothetical protein
MFCNPALASIHVAASRVMINPSNEFAAVLALHGLEEHKESCRQLGIDSLSTLANIAQDYSGDGRSI